MKKGVDVYFQSYSELFAAWTDFRFYFFNEGETLDDHEYFEGVDILFDMYRRSLIQTRRRAKQRDDVYDLSSSTANGIIYIDHYHEDDLCGGGFYGEKADKYFVNSMLDKFIGIDSCEKLLEFFKSGCDPDITEESMNTLREVAEEMTEDLPQIRDFLISFKETVNSEGGFRYNETIH